jgi:catechol 2,3-dioxygenase-like lactoylglutathione lyase family enzyme
LAPPTPPLSGVLEAALYVDDLDAAKAFYGDLLSLEKITEVPRRHVFYRAGDTVVLLFIAEQTRIPTTNAKLPVPPHGAEGAGHLCFAADGEALIDWRDRLEQAGIEIEADFEWPNGARSLYVRDPAGNSIEFAEPKLWA